MGENINSFLYGDDLGLNVCSQSQSAHMSKHLLCATDWFPNSAIPMTMPKYE